MSWPTPAVADDLNVEPTLPAPPLTTFMSWPTPTVADDLNVTSAHDIDVVAHRSGG